MATDFIDNNIRHGAATNEGDENLEETDIAVEEDIIEADIVPLLKGVPLLKSPGFSVSKTVISTLTSSSPTTLKMSDNLSRAKLALPRQTILGGDMPGAVALMPGEISLTDLPSGLGNFIGYVGNSTSAAVASLSANMSQSSSSNYWSPEEIGAAVVVSVMVPFILLSNLIVIVSVIRFRRLHTPTNYFITSLAAVDILVALATPFEVVVEVFNNGSALLPEDVLMCLLPNRILMMACGVSVLTLAAIAYDRQTALVSPLEYIGIMTYKKVAIVISLIWIYSSLIAWIPLMAGWYNMASVETPCSANLIQGKAPILFMTAVFIPSCVAIFVCYFRICIVARHHAKAIAAVENAIHRHLQVKFMVKDTKYAKTLALLIGVFLLLWLPYLIFIFIQTISETTFNVWIQTYLILLTVFNSGINPWLYAFKNNELRAAFKKLFREIFRNRFCLFNDRRTSLISAISATPRLSRTDSRMACIIPDVTLCIINEKLKQSLESLDKQWNEYQLDGDVKQQQRRPSVTKKVPDQPFFAISGHSCKQTASCSNFGTLNSADKSDHIRRSRSASVDLTRAVRELNNTTFNEIYKDKSFNNKNLVDSVHSLHYNKEDSSKKYETSCRTHSATSKTANPLKKIKSLPLSSVYVQLPPPKPSQRRSSATGSIHSLFSISENTDQLYHELPKPQNLSSPSDIASSSIKSMTYNCSDDVNVFPEVTWTDVFSQGNSPDSITHPYIQFHYTQPHSLSYTDFISTQQQQHHHLTHANSCPIFEPIMSHHFVRPQLSFDANPSYLRKVPSNLLEDNTDFVSRVHRETDNFHTDQYLV